jgi:phosphoenolpyruvate carboxykinase (ATP)
LLLAEKIQKHGANVWLLNTGWNGGRYGVGKVLNYFNLEN